jgi:3'-phosphoadenosine 5'-phosphosulfate sulfotransferase (PAPS reductase)/FAD synthetase
MKTATQTTNAAHEGAETMDLHQYDAVAISSSAGKDSAAMLAHVVSLADAQEYDRARIHVIHADLGRMEWAGTGELAAEQAAHYGLDFRKVKRPQGDILEQAEKLGQFPTPTMRYCTSDHKRGQLSKVRVQIAKEIRQADKQTFRQSGSDKRPGARAVRILACIGLRAEESSGRAKIPTLERDKRETGKGTVKTVDNWLPIHDWKVGKVWDTIRSAGLPSHYAYDLGMPRLSCVFCIFAPKPALLLAGKHNRELLAEYVKTERKIGHTFKNGLALAEIQAELDAGAVPGKIADEEAACWNM